MHCSLVRETIAGVGLDIGDVGTYHVDSRRTKCSVDCGVQKTRAGDGCHHHQHIEHLHRFHPCEKHARIGGGNMSVPSGFTKRHWESLAFMTFASQNIEVVRGILLYILLKFSKAVCQREVNKWCGVALVVMRP
jgi:hypothetical protein